VPGASGLPTTEVPCDQLADIFIGKMEGTGDKQLAWAIDMEIVRSFLNDFGKQNTTQIYQHHCRQVTHCPPVLTPLMSSST